MLLSTRSTCNSHTLFSFPNVTLHSNLSLLFFFKLQSTRKHLLHWCIALTEFNSCTVGFKKKRNTYSIVFSQLREQLKLSQVRAIRLCHSLATSHVFPHPFPVSTLAPVLSLCESLQGATPALGLVSYLTHWIRSPQSQTRSLLLIMALLTSDWHKLTWKCTQCYLAVTYKAKNILQKPFAILIAYSSVWDAALWELYQQHKGSFCHFLQGYVLRHRNCSNKSLNSPAHLTKISL